MFCLKKFRDIHSGAVGDSVRVLSDIASLGDRFLTFRRNQLSPKHQEPITLQCSVVSQQEIIVYIKGSYKKNSNVF